MSEAMTGQGDYDRHSAAQSRDAASQVDLVAEAASRIAPDTAKGSVVIADYGCAQGRVSNALLRVVVERVRAIDPDVPITVVHNDLLSNDWATLFGHLRSPDSYLATEGGPITPVASATSFYEPVVPHRLVDLGLSFAAIQWLAEPGPAGTGSALYFDQLDGRAREQMASRAHADWTRFLARRADELAAGGRMVVDMMGIDSSGIAAGHDAWLLARAIAEELVDEGILDERRLDAYVLPVYERTLAEVRQPFESEADDASDVEGERESAVGRRLALEHVSIVDSEHPAVARHRETGDTAAFAGEFVGFFRAFSEPSLRAALDPSGTVTAELYERMEARLAAEPGDFDFTVHVLTAVIARI